MAQPDPSQRAVRASLPSLLTLAVCFFLPFVKVCGRMETPLHYASGDILSALWIAPRFLIAGLLAVILGVAVLRRQPPGKPSTIVGLGGMAIAAGGLLFEWVSVLRDLVRGRGVVLAGVMTALVASAALLVVRGLRRRGWQRWANLLVAFALMASTLMPLVLSDLALSRVGTVGIGGYLYLVSILLLAGIGLYGQLQQRRTLASTAPPG